MDKLDRCSYEFLSSQIESFKQEGISAEGLRTVFQSAAELIGSHFHFSKPKASKPEFSLLKKKPPPDLGSITEPDPMSVEDRKCAINLFGEWHKAFKDLKRVEGRFIAGPAIGSEVVLQAYQANMDVYANDLGRTGDLDDLRRTTQSLLMPGVLREGLRTVTSYCVAYLSSAPRNG